MARFWQNNPYFNRRLGWVLVVVVAGVAIYWISQHKSADDKSIEQLSKELSASDPKDRREAAKALANKVGAAHEHGDEGQAQVAAALPAMIAALKDSDSEVRNKILLALEVIGPQARDAVPSILDVLQHDDDTDNRYLAACALVHIKPPPAVLVQAYLLAARDPEMKVSNAAAPLLRNEIQPSDRAAIPPLLAALKDDNLTVRMAALDALGRFAPTATEIIVPLLEAGRDPQLKDRVLKTIGLFGEAAIPTLIEVTHSSTDSGVRSLALAALSQQFPPPANQTPTIGPATTDFQNALALVRAALKDSEPILRSRAALTLGNLGPTAKDAAPDLVPLLKDPNEVVRQTAAVALKRIDPEAAAKAGVP